jgi:serine/threonine protein kinase
VKGDAEEFGPYVVYEQIGLGGMATVHRAETQGIAGFSKQVALKRMLPSVAANASLVQSFIREARLASHLRHANVAQTYDLGKVGDTYFIAMELVPGRNLREILKHCALVAGHMPLAIAMNIVNQIADALDYAHNLCDETGARLGIIHRDVSPSNVIISEGGVAKLIDFGIAKATGSDMQTLSGTIKGKFSYIAPECLAGRVDARSDLFALGVIAHELLSNRPLFQGSDDMDTLRRVKDMPILPPSRINPNVPHEIDAIVMTALERDPEQRWQQATALRHALTTETQRLGLIALDTQVAAWIESAFHRSFSGESEPSIVISRSTVELARGSQSDKLARSPADELLEPTKMERPYTRQQQSTFEVPTVVAEVDRRLLAQTARPARNDEPTREVAVAPSLPLMPPGISAVSEVAVNAPPVRHVSDVGTVLDDLEQRSSVSVRPADVARDSASRVGLSHFLLALLVLIAAGGAAAVVYFALP